MEDTSMSMRKEAELWFLQAEEELDTASISFEAKKWFAVAFWCEQSAEKALKAVYIEKKKLMPQKIHSLTELGKQVSIPSELATMLIHLKKEYMMSRYPDISGDAPYKLYDQKDAERNLDYARKIIKWVRSKLNR